MNEFNFTQWIAVVGPIAALFYAGYREIYALRTRLDKNDERWLSTQEKILDLDKKIYAIMSRLDMAYRAPVE